MRSIHRTAILLGLTLSALLASAGAALAQCSFSGSATGSNSPGPCTGAQVFYSGSAALDSGGNLSVNLSFGNASAGGGFCGQTSFSNTSSSVTWSNAARGTSGTVSGGANGASFTIPAPDGAGQITLSIQVSGTSVTSSGTGTFNGSFTAYGGATISDSNACRPPALSFTKSVADLNGGIVEAGDVLEYTLAVSNAAGAGTAGSLTVTDPIPANTSYLPGSLIVSSGAGAGGKTDAAGDDQAEFDGTQIVFRLGSGASPTGGGSLAGGESALVRFRVQIGAGVAGNVTLTNAAMLTSGTSTLTATASITTTLREIHFAITPDGGSAPSPVPGQSVSLPFTLANTGNINSLAYFPDQGAAIWLPAGSGAFTVTRVFVDYNDNGVFDGGDVDITTSAPGVYPAAFVAAGGATRIVVQGMVSPGAASGASITVRLGSGDGPLPARDDIPNGTSPRRIAAVQHVGNAPDNGYREATGDYVFTVSAGPLVGPAGQPGAVGPTGNNDDYTNRTTVAGLAGVPAGGLTTAAAAVVFTNTVRNNGGSADPMTVTAPVVPPGFTVEISADGGASYADVTGGGGVTLPPVPAGGTSDVMVRITAPVGVAVLAGYDTVIRVTSSFAAAATNDTVDRLYTGFIRSVKAQLITNSTGVGGPSDAVSGAVTRYSVTYTNITTAGGTGNVNLTASNVTITEDGNLAPNNWAGRTNQVVGSAADTSGGAITGDAVGSGVLTVTISTLGPGASGTFSFSRRIR